MQVSYKEFVDRVKGCFLGKTVIGTLGAPYEGVKMPMNLQFKPEMIDTMLPNDDLDLQVLWLEVVEKKGFRFTSKDLLDSFCSNCDYSPGEYAIMRKNHEKTWKKYIKLCKFGGQAPFVALLEHNHLRNPFEDGNVKKNIKPLLKVVKEFDTSKF